jgi:hypothetical protein
MVFKYIRVYQSAEFKNDLKQFGQVMDELVPISKMELQNAKYKLCQRQQEQ